MDVGVRAVAAAVGERLGRAAKFGAAVEVGAGGA
jgi:hypothetical protein